MHPVGRMITSAHIRSYKLIDEMNEWRRVEFNTLRSEIESAKDRLFKLFFGGITLPLAVIAVIIKFPEISLPIVYALPILLLAIYFRYEHERKVIHRAGCYIRENIEPKSNKGLGWETWLYHNNNKHLPSRSLTLSFNILTTLYYFIPFIILIDHGAKMDSVYYLSYLQSHKIFSASLVGFTLLWVFVVARPIKIDTK